MKRNQVSELSIEEVSLCGEGVNADARAVIVKAVMPGHTSPHPSLPGGVPGYDDGELFAAVRDYRMDINTLTEALNKAKAEIEALQKSSTDKDAQIATLTKAVEDANKATEIAKAVADPKAAEDAMIEKAEPAMKALLLKAREDRETIAKMAAEREEERAIAKARADGMPEPEKTGPALARIAKGAGTKDDAEVVERVVKAALEQAKAGGAKLFAVIGKSVGGDANSPEAIIKARAADLRKAKPTLTEAQAEVEVMNADPDLYARYKSGRAA